MAGSKPLTGQASKTYGTSEAALRRPRLICRILHPDPIAGGAWRAEQYAALRAPRRQPKMRGVFVR